MFIPLSNMQKSAGILETHDLKEAIRKTRDKILDRPKPFDVSVLAKYGLILCRELYARTNCPPPVKQTFWMSRFRGAPEWPEFMESYYSMHRAFLALMGWTRYLNSEYGFEPDDLAKLMTDSSDSVELDARIKVLLRPDDDGSSRQYSQFTELPGAYQLYPKE